LEEKMRVKDLLEKMMREALESFHRRLVVVSGEESNEVISFLILKHRELKSLTNNESEYNLVYVDYWEDGGEQFKTLMENLANSGFPNESIVHYTYEESNKLLGTTNDFLIMDMSKGARANDIGRLVETVRGGGLIILHSLDLKADKPWETSIHKSFVHPPYTWKDINSRFEKYFVKKIMETPGTWILDGWKIIKGELLHPPKTLREKPKIPEKTKIPKRLYKLALTEEQAKALQIVEETMRSEGRNVLLITSNRGRGKSALLGLSAAMLLHFGVRKIVITAPSGEENQVIFGMIEKGLNALREKFIKEQRGGSPRIKCKRGIIEFSLPQKALREEAEILMVDEAAGMPVPLLFTFTERFPKVIFASTIHGYEGAGRGFSLRFLKALQENKSINLYRFELKEPIRYAPKDPVEEWLYEALLLDAEPVDLDAVMASKIKIEECKYEKPDLDHWFEEDEKRLREFIGIYVLAHYRNRPDDLIILGDAPHHSARAITARSGEIIGALHIAEEGEMPDDLINSVLSGNPPSGNLIPSCIVKYYPPYKEFARLRGLRVVRIAVHPELIDRGIGSLALNNLCREAAEQGFDWVGASFGADSLLLNFWLKNGFIPVHISPMKNIISGEYSVAVIKPLSPEAEEFAEKIYMEFKIRFLNSLPDTYFNLEPNVAMQLLNVNKWDHLEEINLTQSQRERLLSYIQENLAYEGTCDAVKQLLLTHFLSSGKHRIPLSSKAEIELIARCLQCRSWDRVAKTVGVHPTDLKSEMRVHVKKLMEHYGVGI